MAVGVVVILGDVTLDSCWLLFDSNSFKPELLSASKLTIVGTKLEAAIGELGFCVLLMLALKYCNGQASAGDVDSCTGAFSGDELSSGVFTLLVSSGQFVTVAELADAIRLLGCFAT